MRTVDEIQVEILKLSELKPRVPKFSRFPNGVRDNHHKAIEAQIWVLVTNPSELTLEAEALGNEWEDSVHDNALAALQWMNDQIDDSPSADWETLILKEDTGEETPKLQRSRCRDGFCGALDCERCHPGNFEEEE